VSSVKPLPSVIGIHTYRLGRECAGKLALLQVDMKQLYLVMSKPWVLLVEKEVGWLVLVGGWECKPQH